MRELCLRVLGGACAKCGAKDRALESGRPLLEVDHVDRSTKSFHPTTDHNRSVVAILAELKKCQLLCAPCHSTKSTIERGHQIAVCGTMAMYARGCRCRPCSAANTLACRRSRRKSGVRARTPCPQHATRQMYGLGCRCFYCAEYESGMAKMYRSRRAGAETIGGAA